MRVHIVTNLFAPDELAGAALFTDLALFLKGRGHDVRVTCTFSYYPAWDLRPEDRGVAVRDEVFEGIPLRRVAMHVPEQPTGRGRLLSDLSFLLSLIRRARHPGWWPEVVLTAIPMLSQSLAQRFLYFGQHIPRLIVIQDFVVEAALELGILRVPGLGGALHGIQRWALRSAETLLTISPGMLDKLRSTVGPDRRTCYVPNWIHGSLQREIDRQWQTGRVRHKGRLFYSGNVGVKQGLPDFLDQFKAAEAAKSGWNLAIHGGGGELGRLQSKVDLTPGCSIGPVLDEPKYVELLLTASACVVTQKAGVGADFLPSKLLPALATGTPVLGVCEPSSPLGEEINSGRFGEVVAPGNPAALAATLHRWMSNPGMVAAFGAKARERAEVYQRDRILSQYEGELLALVATRPRGSDQSCEPVSWRISERLGGK